MQPTLTVSEKTVSQKPNLLSQMDLRSLEWLTVEPLVDDMEPEASEISEQRRMAIVVLLSEISAFRKEYAFPR